MASTRELWILLRARDEASRVVSAFSKNVRAAALAAQAAQKSAEAAAIRQRAQMLKSNGTTAQNIRAINNQVIQLEKQARAHTAAAARAREYRAEQMKAIDGIVRKNNVQASSLERQAKAFTLLAATADQNREALLKHAGATEEDAKAIDNQISMARKRAATLNAEAAVLRGASASMIASLQHEQTGLDGSIRSYERRAAAIRAQAAILRNAAQEQGVSLNNQVRVLTNQAAALDRQANALRRSANAARNHDIQMRKLHQSLGKVSEAATVAAFSLAAIGVGGLVGLKNAIDTAVAYEKQVRATATQVDGFKGNLEELGNIGKRVANEIAVPFESIQPALFDIFSSMEVNMADAEKLLKAFSKAAVAGQTDIQSVSRATIGILNAFGRPAKDVTKILDMQFQLIQEGIGTYEEWNQRIGLVTPSAVRFGQSIEMMMAALATATRTGTSAARSATAVSRAMDALSHPAAVKNLKELGVAVQDAQGKFRPMNQILRDFRDVLRKMPEKDRLAAILNVFKGAGGTIEARRFLQNMLLGKNSLELFDNILGETENSAGSMEKAYATMADGTAAKTELLRNKWQLLKEAIGKALLPAFNDLIDKLSEVMDWFNRLPDSTKKAISQFLLWGSVITLVLGGMFAFIGIAAIFIGAIMTIGTAAAVTLGILFLLPIAILAIGLAFYKAYQNSESFRNIVNDIGDTLKELWGIVKDTATSIKESFNRHVLPPLRRLRDVIEDKVLPAARKFIKLVKDEIMPKIKEASRIIQDLADKYLKKVGDVIDDTVIPALKELADWWDKNGEKLKPLIESIGELVKWILILAAIITGVLLVLFVGPLIAGIGLVVGAFQLLAMGAANVTDLFKQLWEWAQKLYHLFEEWGASIGKTFGEAFDAAGESVQTFFTNLRTWFQELPGRIETFIQDIPSMGEAFDTGGTHVKTFFANLRTWFEEVPSRIDAFIENIPSISEAWDNAGTHTGTFFANLKTWFEEVPGRIDAFIEDIPRIGDAWDSAGTHVNTFFTDLMTHFEDAPGRIQTAIQGIPEMVTGIFTTALYNAAYAVGYYLGMVYNNFALVVPTVGAALAGFPALVWGYFLGAMNGASTIVGNGVLKILSWFNSLPIRAAAACARLWPSISGHFSQASSGAANSAGKLVLGFLSKINALPISAARVCSAARDAIIDTFRGAGGWLIEAGRDIIRGAIQGIGDMIGSAVDVAREAGHRIVKGFKDATGVKSPSKVFKDIGYNLIRGLINGITGTRKALQNALAKITHDVMSSLNAGNASKKMKDSWAKRLKDTSKKLLSLETKRAQINAKIAATQKSLNEQIKARTELAAKIKEKLSEGADITTLKGANPAQIKKNLQQRLKDLQDFQQNLNILRSKGLNAESIAELAQAGVEGAGDLVKGLAKGSSSDIQQINSMQKQIRAIAGDMGNKVAGQMYDAGINAAKGLIKGLQSQSAAITKEMTKIANSLIAAIKKALGIKSPSKVFEGIGANTALGYLRGYKKQMMNAPLHAEMLAYSSRPGFQGASAQGAENGGRVFNQYITVHTNEIDPRLTAAQLGYELEGRIK